MSWWSRPLRPVPRRVGAALGHLYLVLALTPMTGWTQSVLSSADEGRAAAQMDTATYAIGYKLVREQLELSYITLLGGAGNIQPLLFEANVAPNFAVAWRNHALVATPKVLLRMFNDSTGSAPIRTPSFMPHLTWYYWGPPFLRSAAGRLSYMSLRFSHHSNGQAGPFLLEDSDVPNTLDGSFSTNFFEIAYHRAFGVPEPMRAAWVKYGFRFHIPFNENQELRRAQGDSQYGRYRLLLSGSRRGILPFVPWFDPLFIARAEYFYILDSNFQNEPFFSWDRLGLSLTWIWVLKGIEPLGVFANLYLGQDYYNIWYKQNLRVLRVGITARSFTSFRIPH